MKVHEISCFSMGLELVGGRSNISGDESKANLGLCLVTMMNSLLRLEEAS